MVALYSEERDRGLRLGVIYLLWHRRPDCLYITEDMATTEVLQPSQAFQSSKSKATVIVGHTEAYTQDGVFSPTASSRALRKGGRRPPRRLTASCCYYRGTELDGRLRRCGVTYCGI